MPRYLSLVKVEEKAAAQGPSPELMQRMGELIEEMTKAGVMLDTAGLTPTSEGTRVHWEDGRLSVTDGPFTEAKEVIGGFALINAKDLAEAVSFAESYAALFDEIEVEVRTVVEAEDIEAFTS